jgi:hypothetical protein
MPNTLLPIQPSSLTETCYANEQTRLNDFAAHLFAILAGQSFYNFGDTKPGVDQNQYPWFRTIDYRWYTFSGTWISATNHDLDERRLFVGSEDDLKTFDGGNTNIPSDRNGPMWEIDHDFDARFPVGPGTFPSGTVVNPTSAGGEEKVTLTTAQLPAHTHPHGDPTANFMSAYTTTPNQNVYRAFDSGAGDCSFNENTGITGSDVPHNNVPPYRGIYIIKWTGRLYYNVP